MRTQHDIAEIEVSVVIPVRNRRADLSRCLTALADQDFPPNSFEVIVCDDGSDENLNEVLESANAQGLQVRYVKQEAKGPAAARNLGIRDARGKIVALTDSDTLPKRSWLRMLHQALVDNPDAVGAEGKVYAENEGEFQPLGEGPTNKSGGVYLTCNCAYRRDALFQVGGFDETFPYPAYEDTELAACMKQIGQIVWQPDAIIIHPQRPLTLKTIMKKLRHWEYVLLMGYRYGYLAWPQYPVSYPKIRVVALAVLALPFSKLKDSVRWWKKKPVVATRLVAYGLVESLGALVWIAPRILFSSFRSRIPRHNYLNLTIF